MLLSTVLIAMATSFIGGAGLMRRVVVRKEVEKFELLMLENIAMKRKNIEDAHQKMKEDLTLMRTEMKTIMK